MRIYIIEDDDNVVSVLEDIVEDNGLGEVCGASEDGCVQLERVLASAPDMVLVDLLMPGMDGIEAVRQLKELGCRAKFIMISQVSAKEMIAKAYQAGVDFFINKPINLIEVCQVVRNVARQIENEKALAGIQSILQPQTARPAPDSTEQWRRSLRYVLSQLGMAGEKGAQDIENVCLYLLKEGKTASQVGLGTLFQKIGDTPKTTEQRIRRAVERGLRHVAHLGLEDYGGDAFTRYASRLFSFQEVRCEMAFIQGKGSARGKVNLKMFLDGLLIILEEH